MAEDPINTTTLAPSAPSPSPAPSSAPAIDPKEHARLQAYYDSHVELDPVIDKISERWEDVAPLIEDDDSLEYWRAARKSRQRLQDEAKPKLSPEMELFRDELDKKYGPVAEWAAAQRQEREQTTQAQQQAAIKTNLDYAQRLIAERPEFAERNYAAINMLAQVAYRDQVSLEEAYKQNSGLFGGGPVQKKEPPPSLRAGAAAPGVPGESTDHSRITSRTDLRKRLAQNLRAAGLKG